MPSAKVNKWIFGTTLGIVVSLPLMIPGCTPISGDIMGGNTNAILGEAMVAPIIDIVNQEAQGTGQAATLQDVIDMSGTGESVQLTGTTPVYTIDGDHINVTLGETKDIICTITIENQLAVSKC